MTENNTNTATDNGSDNRNLWLLLGGAVLIVLIIIAILLATRGNEDSTTAESIVDPALTGKVWKWYQFTDPQGTTVVPDPNQYTVEFLPDGTVHAKADCNVGNGTYSAESGTINIQIMAMTMAMCPPESLSDEFINRLNNAAIYSFDGSTLLLDMPMDSGTMLLAEDPPQPTPEVDPALIGKTWQWYEYIDPLGITVVSNPDQYTVEFTDDGGAHAKADCNSGNGAYRASNGNIKIEIMAMTRAMCPPESLSDDFVARLNQVVIYSFQGDTLLLELPADGGTMLLSENPPEPEPIVDPALIGKTWKWFAFQSPMGNTLIPDPDQYTVEFNSDGTLNVKADCNNASGSYTAQDGSITIEMGPMTMAMCGPDSLSEQFVSRLDYAAIYFFQGDDLLLDLFADGGTMGFSENPPPPPPEPTQPPAVDPALIGKVWKWFEFLSPDGERIFVNNPEQYTVEFLGDGSVRVNADCNSANGSYTASRGSINIEILTMTRAACPPGSYSDQFVNLLNTAAIYFFSGDTLLMDLPMDSGTMQLAVQPPTAQPPVDAALIGKVWTWQEFRAPDGEQVLINDPQQYTVQFAADGTLAVKADCNNGNGTYTASNGNININSTMAMTMAFCPPGSYGNQFVNALFAAAVYRFESGDLFLDLQANAGTMRFKPR